MREKKCRAWSKSCKQMLSWEDILMFNYGFDDYQYDDPEFLDFIGLHDKNEKEIYDGDIFENQSGRGIIEWWQDHCCFGARKIGTDEMFIITSKGKTFNTEVIGNIYENPELLSRVADGSQ